MTTDYKALAGRVKTAIRDYKLTGDLCIYIDDLRTLVTLMEGMAEQEPIYAYEWDTYGGGVRRSFSQAPYNGREPKRTLILYAHPAPQPQAEPTVPDNSQEWARLDGVTAYHLIERHADNWADIGKMMDEWLAARSSAMQPHPERQPVSEPTRWKVGNELAPYHTDASHVEPGYRDGWNACYWAMREGEPTEAQIEWPARADEGMLRAMIGWRECDGREGLSGEASLFDRVYHALYSHMRDRVALAAKENNDADR